MHEQKQEPQTEIISPDHNQFSQLEERRTWRVAALEILGRHPLAFLLAAQASICWFAQQDHLQVAGWVPYAATAFLALVGAVVTVIRKG